MVHEHWLYHIDGCNPTQPTLFVLVPGLYRTVCDLCVGRLDPWINGHDDELYTDQLNRSSGHNSYTIMTEDILIEFVNKIDNVIANYPDEPAHNLAGVLLSRVTLLMTSDPATGKELLKYVWNKLDELEQSNPNQYL